MQADGNGVIMSVGSWHLGDRVRYRIAHPSRPHGSARRGWRYGIVVLLRPAHRPEIRTRRKEGAVTHQMAIVWEDDVAITKFGSASDLAPLWRRLPDPHHQFWPIPQRQLERVSGARDDADARELLSRLGSGAFRRGDVVVEQSVTRPAFSLVPHVVLAQHRQQLLLVGCATSEPVYYRSEANRWRFLAR